MAKYEVNPARWGFCHQNRRYLGYGAPSAQCFMALQHLCVRGDCLREFCPHYEERQAVPGVHRPLALVPLKPSGDTHENGDT